MAFFFFSTCKMHRHQSANHDGWWWVVVGGGSGSDRISISSLLIGPPSAAKRLFRGPAIQSGRPRGHGTTVDGHVSVTSALELLLPITFNDKQSRFSIVNHTDSGISPSFSPQSRRKPFVLLLFSTSLQFFGVDKTAPFGVANLPDSATFVGSWEGNLFDRLSVCAPSHTYTHTLALFISPAFSLALSQTHTHTHTQTVDPLATSPLSRQPLPCPSPVSSRTSLSATAATIPRVDHL